MAGNAEGGAAPPNPALRSEKLGAETIRLYAYGALRLKRRPPQAMV